MVLKRQIHPIPDYVIQALTGAGMLESYYLRPPYQQNDYIGWITRAKREMTRQKRLDQMLDELRSGNKYMGMDYKARPRE